MAFISKNLAEVTAFTIKTYTLCLSVQLNKSGLLRYF